MSRILMYHLYRTYATSVVYSWYNKNTHLIINCLQKAYTSPKSTEKSIHSPVPAHSLHTHLPTQHFRIGIIPLEMAVIIRSATLRAPSLSSRCRRCVSTVLVDTHSSRAISCVFSLRRSVSRHPVPAESGLRAFSPPYVSFGRGYGRHTDNNRLHPPTPVGWLP